MGFRDDGPGCLLTGFVAGLLLASCHAAVPVDTDAGEAVDAGLILTTSPCPPQLPEAHAPCTNPLSPMPGTGETTPAWLICEYGGDGWGNCSAFALCWNGAWDIGSSLAGLILNEEFPDAGYLETTPDAGCLVGPESCPASFDMAKRRAARPAPIWE